MNLFWAIFHPLFCHQRRHSFYLQEQHWTIHNVSTSTNQHQPPRTTPPPTTQTPPLRSLTSGFGQFHRVSSATVVGGVESLLDGPSRRLVFERWQFGSWNDQMPRFLQRPQFFVQPVQHHKGVLVVLFVGGFDVGSHSIVGIVSVFFVVRGVPDKSETTNITGEGRLKTANNNSKSKTTNQHQPTPNTLITPPPIPTTTTPTTPTIPPPTTMQRSATYITGCALDSASCTKWSNDVLKYR